MIQVDILIVLTFVESFVKNLSLRGLREYIITAETFRGNNKLANKGP